MTSNVRLCYFLSIQRSNPPPGVNPPPIPRDSYSLNIEIETMHKYNAGRGVEFWKPINLGEKNISRWRFFGI